MKRRDFFASAAGAGLTAASAATTSMAQSGGAASSQYYEWRTYRLETEDQQRRVSEYLHQAALPAWARIGVGPVGVWTETGNDASRSLHVLLAFPSIQQFADERSSLEADPEYQSAARDYMDAPKEDPAFSRIESSLMVAFDGMPMLEPPKGDMQHYELRIYESYSEAKARRKIEMFNNGEIPIFVKAGFHPVFFGETLIGSQLPNLKYMLASKDADAHQEAWREFGSHPDWVAMKDLPQYADTVSRHVSIALKPTEYSAI